MENDPLPDHSTHHDNEVLPSTTALRIDNNSNNDNSHFSSRHTVNGMIDFFSSIDTGAASQTVKEAHAIIIERINNNSEPFPEPERPLFSNSSNSQTGKAIAEMIVQRIPSIDRISSTSSKSEVDEMVGGEKH